jgi:hypothetical protein
MVTLDCGHIAPRGLAECEHSTCLARRWAEAVADRLERWTFREAQRTA